MANKERKIVFYPDLLKEQLKENNMTVKELSEKTGISIYTLNQALTQKIIMPDVLETICEFLNVSPKYIRGDLLFKESYDHYIYQKNSLVQIEYISDKERWNSFYEWLKLCLENKVITKISLYEEIINELETRAVKTINEYIKNTKKKGNNKR